MTTAGRPPEFLKCIKCHDVFTEPVTLHCGHTFCARCIGAHAPHQHDYNDRRRVKCYLCGFSGKRPYLHNRAFFIKRLAEQYKSNGGYVLCGLCKDKRRANPAEFWCTYCGYSMCRECRDRLESSHTTVIRPKCEKHVNFVIDMLCEDCQEAVCQKCSTYDHKGCRVIRLGDALSEIDQLLREHAEELEDSIPTLESHICQCENAAKKLHVAIYDAERAIDETGTRFVSEIRKQQKELKEQLRRSNEKTLNRLENEVQIGKLKLQDTQQRIGFAEEAKNSISEMDHFEIYQKLRSGRESDYRQGTNGIGYAPNVRFEENRDTMASLKRDKIGELTWENTAKEPREPRPKRDYIHQRGIHPKQRVPTERNYVPRRDDVPRQKDVRPEKNDREKTWTKQDVPKNDHSKEDNDRKERRAEPEPSPRKREASDWQQSVKIRNIDTENKESQQKEEKPDTEREVQRKEKKTQTREVQRKEEKTQTREVERKEEKTQTRQVDRKEEKTQTKEMERSHAQTQTHKKEKIKREEQKVQIVGDEHEEWDDDSTDEEDELGIEDETSKVDKLYRGKGRPHTWIARIDTRKKGVHGITVFTLRGTKLIVVTNSKVSSIQSFYAENGDYTKVRDSMLSVECPAHGITKVNNTEAVMTMPQKKLVVVLQVGPKPEARMRIVETINFGMPYTDLACLTSTPPNPPLLVVSGRRGNPIEIVDLSGRRLRGFANDVFNRGTFLCSGLDNKTWMSDVREQKVVSCTFALSKEGDWEVNQRKHLRRKSVFRRPCGICRGAEGDIFVVERRLHRVAQLSRSGKFVRNVLTFERDETANPFALHIDSDNLVYVSVDDRYIQVHKMTQRKKAAGTIP